jgi:hypothetical protein
MESLRFYQVATEGSKRTFQEFNGAKGKCFRPETREWQGMGAENAKNL